jgi:cytoskeleton protein RodZ
MDETESLGKYLKKERELRNISLRDVARNTRVREPFIQALEEDRLDRLPPPTIVKGFLQSYAKYVGLDPNAVLLRFQALLKGSQGPPAAEPPRKTFSIKKTWWTAAGGVAALFGIVLILYALFDSKPPQPGIEGTLPASKKETPVAETKVPDPGEQAPGVKEGIAVAPAPIPSPGPEKKLLTLGMKAVEKTWLHIQSSEKPDMDVILQPGENLSVQDGQRIELLVGNAGGLDLIFNGMPMEKSGKSGEVVTLIFTPQGIETKRHEKPKPLK